MIGLEAKPFFLDCTYQALFDEVLKHGAPCAPSDLYFLSQRYFMLDDTITQSKVLDDEKPVANGVLI